MKSMLISQSTGKITIEFWTRGKILKNERKQRKLSLGEVAQKSKITQGYLSQMEREKRPCPDETFLRIMIHGFNFLPKIARKILSQANSDAKKRQVILTICEL